MSAGSEPSERLILVGTVRRRVLYFDQDRSVTSYRKPDLEYITYFESSFVLSFVPLLNYLPHWCSVVASHVVRV